MITSKNKLYNELAYVNLIILIIIIIMIIIKLIKRIDRSCIKILEIFFYL